MSVVLTKEWHKGTMARAVPGARWDGATKAWVLDYAEARSAAIALKLFPDLGYRHPELNAMRDELAADVRPFDFASTWYEQHGSRLGCDRVRKVVKAKGWDLHEYQEVDLAYGNAVLNERGAFYMGWERGLGKTLGTCCLLDARGWESALIVAPNTAKESVWGEALREFCPWLELIVLGNTKAARSRALNQVERCFENAKPFALVVHYEALALIAGKEKVERSDGKTKTVLGNGWSRLGAFDVMVTDEDHRLANPQAQMFKGARKKVFGRAAHPERGRSSRTTWKSCTPRTAAPSRAVHVQVARLERQVPGLRRGRLRQGLPGCQAGPRRHAAEQPWYLDGLPAQGGRAGLAAEDLRGAARGAGTGAAPGL
jgi:hypothetical protein